MTTAAPIEGRLTDVAGVAVGHWSDFEARTGCTVVLVPPGTIASGEVRGGAPASREMALLDPTRTVTTIDAVVLTGGSAFGLGVTDGVMAHLESLGRGFPTPAARVPIVPTLGLYDLGVGDPTVRPDANAGLAAARNASTNPHEIGRCGAGTGCTTGKWPDASRIRPGGLVAASARVGDDTVACLVAVNAAGSVGSPAQIPEPGAHHGMLGTNTTIGVIITSAPLGKRSCHQLARAAHNGLARSVFPSHTRFDGDAFIACATGFAARAERPEEAERGDGDADLDALTAATTCIVETAVLSLDKVGQPSI